MRCRTGKLVVSLGGPGSIRTYRIHPKPIHVNNLQTTLCECLRWTRRRIDEDLSAI